MAHIIANSKTVHVAKLIPILCVAFACGCSVRPATLPAHVTDAAITQAIAAPSAAATAIPLPASPTADQRRPLTGSGGGVLAFRSDRGGSPGIYVMNADGTDQRLVTDRLDSSFPAFSPDGERIAFTTTAPYMGHLTTIAPDGSDERVILARNRSISAPDWSPDGASLVFIFHTHQYFSVSVMGVAGSDYLPLTEAVTEQINASPHWSPDGNRIVFSSNRGGDSEIYVMDADGRNVQQLTDNDVADYHPSWSPDGSHIVFASSQDGNWDIYLMDPQGRNVRRLTEDSAMDWEPAWSPDGTRLAFSSNRDGDWEIFTMHVDGSALAQLTDDPAEDSQPDWRPR